jgi:hypothetical protein
MSLSPEPAAQKAVIHRWSPNGVSGLHAVDPWPVSFRQRVLTASDQLRP